MKSCNIPQHTNKEISVSSTPKQLETSCELGTDNGLQLDVFSLLT